MNLRRLISFGAILLILAIVVYGFCYFSARLFFPSHTESVRPVSESVSESPPPKLPFPFGKNEEAEIKPASEIWLRWENLKKETDMAVE